MDGFNSPRVDWLKGKIRNNYDKILSFIPPVISGRYALKVKEHFLRTTPLIQFWTDPLSLGRLNGINEIPRERWLHKYLENRMLNGGGVSKIVFCYPLLMAMEASLHPDAAHKMTWSDVSFMPHKNQTMHVNQRPIIGLFGAYQQHVRNIRPLLEAIQELPDFDFIIRGDGDLPFDISGITNLDLKSGRIPLTEVEELEDKCDVLLSLAGKSGITHPAGKTFYYADYKKPIIHIGDGKHALYFKGYLDEFGSRFIHCFNSKEEIKNSINEAVNKAKEFTLIIPERMDASLIVRKILDL